MSRHQVGAEELTAVGWISIADVFVLLTVLLLSICLSFVRPTSTQSAVTAGKDNWIVAVDRERAGHAAKLAAAEQERAALTEKLKSHQATAASQVSELDDARKEAA